MASVFRALKRQSETERKKYGVLYGSDNLIPKQENIKQGYIYTIKDFTTKDGKIDFMLLVSMERMGALMDKEGIKEVMKQMIKEAEMDPKKRMFEQKKEEQK